MFKICGILLKMNLSDIGKKSQVFIAEGGILVSQHYLNTLLIFAMVIVAAVNQQQLVAS